MSDELQPGEVVADHRIEGVLGRGGMGVVYRARQVTLDRPAAVKLIAPTLSGDASFRARFLREARAAAGIDHPNVLPVYSAGEEGGRLYVSSRLIEGGDLHARIRARGRLSPQEAIPLLEQVAAALDAAHAAGLVHRDVKAANVLVDDAGRAYLTDFGVARLRDASTDLTGAGQMVGTLDSVAPEQIEGREVTERSDVYSLGCLLFEMLTGHAVFADRHDVASKLAAHTGAPPPSARAEAPEVPEARDAVIARALAKRPADRYASAGELAAAARGTVSMAPPTVALAPGAAPAEATAVAPPAAPPPASAPTAVSGDDRPRRVLGLPLPAALGIGGAAVAAILLVIGVLALSGGSGEEEPPPPDPTEARVTVTEARTVTEPATTLTEDPPEPTTQAPPPPPPPETFDAALWQSPTGNLRCEVIAGPFLFCSSVADGFAVELDEVRLPRSGPVPQPVAPGGQVVPYGETWRNGVFSCRSQQTGITCTSTTSGNGFLLARGEYQEISG